MPINRSGEPNALPTLRRPVNWRSLLLGWLGVLFICTLTPYNNYVLLNTDFVGNHLPASLLVFFLLFVICINGLLWRFAPRHAFTQAELAVAVGMTLVGCALPSVGLMRYLPGHLISFFSQASIDSETAQLMKRMSLPDWLWPTFDSLDPAVRGNEPVVRDFVGQTYGHPDSFAGRWAGVPWMRWVVPTFSWSILFAAIVGAVLSLTLIFRRQWVENEKLSFPLASIYISLIESPQPGRSLNRLLLARSFWIAFAVVFLLHGLNALSVYDPQHWPELSLGYNLNAILADAPWQFTSWGFKAQRIYFTIIGIMFFVPGRVAFSLWFFYLLVQVMRMGYGTYQADFTLPMAVDQLVGSLMTMGIVTIWIGRAHLLNVIRQMFGRGESGSRGRYLPEGVAGWMLLISVLAMITWLTLAGASIPGAMVIVGVLLLVWIVSAKVVGETGLLYVMLAAPAGRIWLYVSDITGGVTTTVKSFFFSSWFFGLFQHDTRETMIVYATHAVRVADEQAYPEEKNWRRGFPLLLALVSALVIGYFVAGASSLYIHYGYSNALDQSQDLVGRWGSFEMPRIIALNDTMNVIPPKTGPIESHSRVGHFLGGAGFTAFLAMMNLRFAAWPLHPVGYLLANSWGMESIWFSIFLGWGAKTMLVRFGGATLYRESRPMFVGLIFGEAAAVAFWLCVSLILNLLGEMYHAIRILPV